MTKVLATVLALTALQAVLADHSTTPSVSNVPSTTTTQTPSSSAVPSGGQVGDGLWDQLESWKFCDVSNADSDDPSEVYQTWFAKYFYFIDKTFMVDQCIKWYHLESNCLADGQAFLEVCFRGTGGPFGSALRDSVYTLQRMEFHNMTVREMGWRGVARIKGSSNVLSGYDVGTPWCEVVDPDQVTVGWAEEFQPSWDDSKDYNGCWLANPWLLLPHYNAYEQYGDELLSVTLMVEDVLTDFDVLVRGDVIKAPDTASITPTLSATPTQEASGTPSNSPVGPYATGWQQYMPRLDCDEEPWPIRRDFDFVFDVHDGEEIGGGFIYGNITGYPSAAGCQMDWRKSWSAHIIASTYSFLETARKEGKPGSFTLIAVDAARQISFIAHRWRATAFFNDPETGCSCGTKTSTASYFTLRKLERFADCCHMFSDWTYKQFATIHQHDMKHDDKWHRHAQVSDLFENWYEIDHAGTYMDYYPADRGAHDDTGYNPGTYRFTYDLIYDNYYYTGQVLTRDLNDEDKWGNWTITSTDNEAS